MTNYQEYATDGVTWVVDRSLYYDNDNRVTTDQSNSRLTNGSVSSSTTNNTYIGPGGADQGVISSSYNSVYQNGTWTNTTTTYNYDWWGQPKVSLITVQANTTGTTQHHYDVNGNLTGIYDPAGYRTINYTLNALGQVVTRSEQTVVRNFVYLNGRAIGDFGTDRLASDIDYAQQLASSRNNSGAGPSNNFTPNVGVVRRQKWDHSNFNNYLISMRYLQCPGSDRRR